MSEMKPGNTRIREDGKTVEVQKLSDGTYGEVITHNPIPKNVANILAKNNYLEGVDPSDIAPMNTAMQGPFRERDPEKGHFTARYIDSAEVGLAAARRAVEITQKHVAAEPGEESWENETKAHWARGQVMNLHTFADLDAEGDYMRGEDRHEAVNEPNRVAIQALPPIEHDGEKLFPPTFR
jgi:hypothetical protein